MELVMMHQHLHLRDIPNFMIGHPHNKEVLSMPSILNKREKARLKILEQYSKGKVFSVHVDTTLPNFTIHLLPI